jgi:hypothetical protein
MPGSNARTRKMSGHAKANARTQGGSHEQHVKAGQQSHKNS